MRIEDSRAFLGGLALVIIGAILSVMTAFYLLPDVFGEKALMARWWWEIVLNLQILAYAFMWFCHHNRLVLSRGGWRVRAISHFVTGVISVSYPVLILIISAYMDWFRSPPPDHQVYALLFIGAALWVLGTFIMPVLHWLMVRRENAIPFSFSGSFSGGFSGGLGPESLLKAYWPTLVGIVIGVLELKRGGYVGFAFLPVLMYLQGALPYFAKSQHASSRDGEI